MNIRRFKEVLKSDYEAAEPSIRLRLYGWGEVERKMENRRAVLSSYAWRRVVFALIIIGIVGAISLGFWQDVEAAMPGSLLYPVKRFSEEVVEKATGDTQPAIDNRAEEIINMAHDENKNPEDLKRAVSDYKDNVIKAQKRIKDMGKTNKVFEKKLKEQHKEFDKVTKEHPEAGKTLKEAKDVSGGDE